MGFSAASTSEWANEEFDLLRKHFSNFSFGAKGVYPILNWTDEPLRALLMSILLLIGLTTTHLTIQASHYIRIRTAQFIGSLKLKLIKSDVIWCSRSTRWHLKLSWTISDDLISLVLPKLHKRRMCCCRNSRRHHRKLLTNSIELIILNENIFLLSELLKFAQSKFSVTPFGIDTAKLSSV